ncbi:hypothetical protein D9B98_00645 [Corynebacterium diphtheriae]|nr:hypothetical protein D9B98_00645 [Corynebacterium diphtheriae]
MGNHPRVQIPASPQFKPLALVARGFLLRWCPLLRLLELKTTKTQGRDFLAKMPSLGFRGLEFEFSDSQRRQQRRKRSPRRSSHPMRLAGGRFLLR